MSRRGKGGNRSGGFDGGDFSRAFLDPFNYGHDHGNWRGGKVVKNAGGGRRQVILNTGAGVGNQFGAKTVRDRGRMGLGGNHSGPIDGSRNVRGGHLHDSHDPHFSSGGRAGRRGGRIGQRGGPRRNLKGEKGHAAASADDLNDELDRFFQREPTSKKASLDHELDAYFDKSGAGEGAAAEDEAGADVGEDLEEATA